MQKLRAEEKCNFSTHLAVVCFMGFRIINSTFQVLSTCGIIFLIIIVIFSKSVSFSLEQFYNLGIAHVTIGLLKKKKKRNLVILSKITLVWDTTFTLTCVVTPRLSQHRDRKEKLVINKESSLLLLSAIHKQFTG